MRNNTDCRTLVRESDRQSYQPMAGIRPATPDPKDFPGKSESHIVPIVLFVLSLFNNELQYLELPHQDPIARLTDVDPAWF